MLRECIISAYSGIYIESDDVETALRGTFLKKKKKKSCREALGAMENAEILPDLKKKKKKILWNFTDFTQLKNYDDDWSHINHAAVYAVCRERCYPST